METTNDMARVSDKRPRQNFKTEVLVVGGGAAGLAAACTAARAGARVLLLEKYGFCGGAAVAGMSGTVCGLYAATDNRSAAPEKVVFGFADRFLDVMKMKDGVTDPIRYCKTFTLTHDPLVWREAGDHLLEEAGVKVLFHTTVVDVLNDGEHVEGVVGKLKGRSRTKFPAAKSCRSRFRHSLPRCFPGYALSCLCLPAAPI